MGHNLEQSMKIEEKDKRLVEEAKIKSINYEILHTNGEIE